MLIDTHCHLNNPIFAGNVGAVLARAREAGVGMWVTPGWDRESSLQALALGAAYPGVLPAVGLHPWFTAGTEDTGWLESFAADPRVVAIGEIGLDGAIEHDDPERQEAAFNAQLALAAARDLPVLLHCRRRWDRLLELLRAGPRVRGVLHAFSGSREILEACLALGLYVAFGGGVTRPNARRAREAAAIAPIDRLLLETDAPNIGLEGVPAAQVEPAHLPRVLTAVAALRGLPPEELAAQVEENTKVLFFRVK